MEKQKIKSVEPMKNPNGCMIETYEGSKGSCWDVGYNTILKNSINQDVLISFQENAKGYNTVVELCPMEQGAVDVSRPMASSQVEIVKVDKGTATGPVAPQPEAKLNFEERKQLSIEAQCLVKCATELATNSGKITVAFESEGLGEFLAMAVNELTGALELAKHNLQCGE